ncbi:MAG TPA: TetR/AcrR family transcriptional regulator [Anaerolineaceae bacterium]|nr:TetR/AcrR family transcriptional regulator [Anaerolineaceae bacterium]
MSQAAPRAKAGAGVQRRSEITRARILQVSQQLFSQNGYDATGVAEICAAAAVSKGAFYHHFPSKQAVFMTLLEGWLAALDEQMLPLLEGARSVAEGIQQAASITGLVFASASGQLPMFLEFWRESSHDPLVWQATIAPYRRYQELFASLVRKGIEEGSLRPVDPNSAARTIVALAFGLILQGVIDPHGADWGEVTQNGIRLFMEGLSK